MLICKVLYGTAPCIHQQNAGFALVTPRRRAPRLIRKMRTQRGIPGILMDSGAMNSLNLLKMQAEISLKVSAGFSNKRDRCKTRERRDGDEKSSGTRLDNLQLFRSDDGYSAVAALRAPSSLSNSIYRMNCRVTKYAVLRLWASWGYRQPLSFEELALDPCFPNRWVRSELVLRFLPVT